MNDITELDSPSQAATQDKSDTNNPPFNDHAKQLKSLVQGILDAPELDTVKVDKIKQSIAKGEYKVDSTNIAKQIIESTKK